MKNSLACVLSNFQRVRAISFEYWTHFVCSNAFRRLHQALYYCLSLSLCMHVGARGNDIRNAIAYSKYISKSIDTELNWEATIFQFKMLSE